MKTLLATIAIATIALTGCNLETPPGIPNVEIGEAATLEATEECWATSDRGGCWTLRSKTIDYGTHTVTSYPDGVTVSATTLDR